MLVLAPDPASRVAAEALAAHLRAAGHEVVAIEPLDRAAKEVDAGVEAAVVWTGDEPAARAPLLAQCRATDTPALVIARRVGDVDVLDDIYTADRSTAHDAPDDDGRDTAATGATGGLHDFAIEPVQPAAIARRLAWMSRRHRAALRHRAIVTALPDLMFRLSRDGTFLDYHAPDPSMLYAPPDRIVGARMSELMPPAFVVQTLAVIAEVLDTGQPGVLEYGLPMADDIDYFEARVVPGGPGEVLTIVRNVSEQKRAEAELRHAADAKKAFSSRVIHVQEAERHKLSRELHDVIGQMLLVHRMDAEWIARQSSSGPVAEAAERLCASLDSTMQNVRELARGLRPPAIDDLGIGSALATLVGELDSRTGIQCSCDTDAAADDDAIPGPVGVAMYRIAQEALANAIRHAQCQHIDVALTIADGWVALAIADDGVGIAPPRESAPSSMGLAGMRERAELLGGRVEIATRLGGGTEVRATFPLAATELDAPDNSAPDIAAPGAAPAVEETA